MTKLRVGVIGCGAIATKRHLIEYATNPNVEIVAVYDKSIERSNAVAKVYNCKVYDDYKKLIDSDDIDAISDCTPNFMHYDILSYAIKKKKHILAEKPLATSVEKAKLICDEASSYGKVFMIDHNQRFTPVHQKAKEVILSKQYGKVISFETNFGHAGPEDWLNAKNNDIWFFKKDASKYGVLGDLGVHKLDLIRYLLDDEYDTISAFGETLDKKDDNGNPIEVIDTAVCNFKMKSNVLGSATFSWTNYGYEDNSTIIYFEKAVMYIYCQADKPLYIIDKKHHETNFELESIQTNENQTSTGVIDSFVDLCLHGGNNIATANDAYKSIEAVEATLESIENKKWVKL